MRLIKRLRNSLPLGDGRLWGPGTKNIALAADLIERQAAQIAMLQEAVNIGSEYANQVLREFDHVYRRHDALEPERKVIYDDVQTINAAIAATVAKPDQCLASIVERVKEQCAQACADERVEETGHDSDKAYNIAVMHCEAAIRTLEVKL